LDDCLCILYSIYQFCINQYAKTVNKLVYLTSNFYLNYTEIEDIDKFKRCFTDTIKNLLSIVTFMKNEAMEKIYIKSISSPSLLTNEIDFNYISNVQKKIKRKMKKKYFQKKKQY
jgi:hypothetical protein